MAEFLVDKLLNELADAVLKNLQDEFKLVTGVEDEVHNLSSKLQIIRKMLQDVQRRKLKEEPVSIWLEKLQDLAHDADDVLDEWNTEVQKLKLKAGEDPNSSSLQLKRTVYKNLRNKVNSLLLQSICSCFKQVSLRHDIARKIKELNGRVEKIFKEADDFKFNLNDLKSNFKDFERIITTSIFDESEVCGREADKNTIVSKLLSDTSNANERICIISIVGTGGIGKTTLAQLVYNDNQVKDNFEVKKWICVSDPFDEKRIAKAILEEPGKNTPDMSSELETLLQRVKASISSKKFLVVLDDVWTEDYNKWKPIWDSLKPGAPGSRIVVTTRSQKVARMMGTNYPHPLNELHESKCWEILSRKAFLRRSESEVRKLTDIGKEISRKCKGLPLAANFLGSLLLSKDTVEEWKNVLESEIWELEEASIGLFPHIYLSYNELSPEMRRCFLYCAIFPKDSVISVEDVIRMWMGQGYLISSGGRDGDLESKGFDCFRNLAMRSFFQNFEKDDYYEGKIVRFKMHDIVHDFAQHIMSGECLIIENLDQTKKFDRDKVRHLTWSYEGDVAESAIVRNAGKLRSFYMNYRKGNSFTFDLFGCLKSVRVLRLCRIGLVEVPRSIGNLIHLRFLDLSLNPFKILPEEICKLYNLETLDVSWCEDLTQVPQRIGNLQNLRHLLNGGTASLEQFPRGLEKLTSLRTLREYRVGNGYSKFGYLRNLSKLGGDLRIEFFEVNEMEFDTAALVDKVHIQGLDFIFIGWSTDYASLAEALQPPPNLKRFALYLYPGLKLPRWITSLNNLSSLRIDGCKAESLPALCALPSLETLQLFGLSGIEILGREFLGITESPAVRVPFRKLEKLIIRSLDNLRRWEDLNEEDDNDVSEAMPCLRVVVLKSCMKLEQLPHRLLRKAKSLEVFACEHCGAIEKRYNPSTKDWIYLSHISQVIIR